MGHKVERLGQNTVKAQLVLQVDHNQSGGKPLYGMKNIGISLIVARNGTNVSYTMIATGPAGTTTSKTFTNPHAHKGNTGPVIIPVQPIAAPKKSDDGERIRVDSCQWVDFHGGPRVTVLQRTAYFGDLGYIDDEDFLL